ncbi:MAG: glutathione S-transferase [Methylococcales symbiont of Iophon sp. n. MRB-2018]|nr:MAG: glutathione S-transferase [Methylococcales symbiont of Iophon sp. n. MRB-2018]KAF3980400.1 MAG: glutathione S-transferase [Methylococcales symbiont of Iophon sp. n. MRB-2018]
MNSNDPILYSFRRCPYAMRARLAIKNSNVKVELREVVLRKKPQQLLNISAKATVPVLQLPDGTVIDESIDIMYWALACNDADNWIQKEESETISQLIQCNDGKFKHYLDCYKYADRYPEHDALFYRQQGELFLAELETRLIKKNFLCGDIVSLADMAIFPFIRQFAHVDLDWFKSSQYTKLNQWLFNQLESPLFVAIMNKYPAWHIEHEITIF